MAKSVMFSARLNNLGSATTRFCSLGNTGAVFSLTESITQRTQLTAGTYSNLYVRVASNTLNATVTVRFRKNTANGSQVLTVTALATGTFEDTTHTDSVSSGDIVGISCAAGTSAGNSINFTVFGVSFTPASNTVTVYGGSGQNTNSTPSATTFVKFCGSIGITWGATETGSEQFKARTAGTLKNLNLVISSNSRPNTSTLGINKNGSASGLQVSIASGATGQFTDTTHTTAISVGDLISTFATLGASAGSLNVASVNTDFETTDATSQSIVGCVSIAYAAGVTRYEATQGRDQNATTETDVRVRAGTPTIFSRFGVYVSANTLTATSTVKFRKNGADSGVSLSIPGGSTGWFEDTSSVILLNSTDESNWKIDAGGTGTSLVIEHFVAKTDFNTTPSVVASTGAVAIAGTAARVLRGYKLTAATGAVAITGRAASFPRTYRLNAAKGAVVISGTAAGLVWSRRYSLTANRGTVSIAGTVAGLRAARRLTEATGSVSIAGAAARLTKGYKLTASVGSYAIAGHNATLTRGRHLTASTSTVSIVGTAARLLYGRKLSAGHATYSISGNAASLYTSANKVIAATRGTYAIAGTAAQLRITRRMPAQPASIVIAANPVGKRHGRVVKATPGSYTILGGATERHFSVSRGRFDITGQDAVLRRGFHMNAASGDFVIEGGPVGSAGPVPVYNSRLFAAEQFGALLVSASIYDSRLFLIQE